MTNQDYMNLLERFSNGESTTEINLKYKDGILQFNCIVETNAFYDEKKDSNKWDPIPQSCTVIEIENNQLIMLRSNIMDAYITGTATTKNIRELYKDNATLDKLNNESNPNYFSPFQIIIPYYENEEERFQREIMGEIVLYETHLKYINNIVQRCHDEYITTMKKTWDNRIKL